MYVASASISVATHQFPIFGPNQIGGQMFDVFVEEGLVDGGQRTPEKVPAPGRRGDRRRLALRFRQVAVPLPDANQHESGFAVAVASRPFNERARSGASDPSLGPPIQASPLRINGIRSPPASSSTIQPPSASRRYCVNRDRVTPASSYRA